MNRLFYEKDFRKVFFLFKKKKKRKPLLNSNQSSFHNRDQILGFFFSKTSFIEGVGVNLFNQKNF